MKNEGNFSFQLEFVPTNNLRHIEGFSQKRVLWLKEKILKEGVWRVPLKIDDEYDLVMDGQHRMEVAKALNFSVVPCIRYNYSRVKVWSLRKSYKVTYQEIIKRSLSGEIYPYKTAKHEFPFGGDFLCEISIKDLR